jgi:hypothetical protein
MLFADRGAAAKAFGERMPLQRGLLSYKDMFI